MSQGISRAHEKWAWTDESTDELIRLWNIEGESGSIIAQKLFCSRSAVIGKVYRLKAQGIFMRETAPATRISSLGDKSLVLSKGPRIRRPLTSYGIKPISARAARPNGQPPGNLQFGHATDKTNPLTAGGKRLLDLMNSRMTGKGLSIEQIGPRQCRNATGGSAPQWLFCGEAVTDPKSSYCPACHPRMYARTLTSLEQQTKAAA